MRQYEINEFGIGALRQVQANRPKPGSGEILVRLRAASVNYRDVMVVNGTYNPRIRLPAIPFSDAAGEVAEVGEAVSNWRIGDRVSPIVVQKWLDGGPVAATAKTAIGAGIPGVLREYGVFPAESLVRLPEHLSFSEASTLPCAALTAWHALVVSGGITTGDTVLTLGTGGVSIFAIQIAKHFGARVISTSGSDDKIGKLKELGADETINYRSVDAWDKAVIELTGGRGVDHVVEVGGAGTLSRSVKAVRVGGHIALIGALDAAGEFSPIPVFMKAIRMQGIFIGSRSMFEDMNEMIGASRLRPVIDREFEFDEASAALEYLASGAHFGKVVVRID